MLPINVLVVYLTMLFSLVCCALFLLLHWPQNLKKWFCSDSFDFNPTYYSYGYRIEKWGDWNESNTIFTWNESNMVFTWWYCKSNGLDNDTLFGLTFQSYNTLVKEPFSIPMFLQFIVLREFWKGLFVTKHMEQYAKIVSKSPDFEDFFFFFSKSSYLDNRF
jgi:hypothetical protein